MKDVKSTLFIINKNKKTMKIIDLKKDINNFLSEPKLQLPITFTVDIVS